MLLQVQIADAGGLHRALAMALGDQFEGVTVAGAGTLIHLDADPIDLETADRIASIAAGFRAGVVRVNRPMAVNLRRRAESFKEIKPLWQ